MLFFAVGTYRPSSVANPFSGRQGLRGRESPVRRSAQGHRSSSARCRCPMRHRPRLARRESSLAEPPEELPRVGNHTLPACKRCHRKSPIIHSGKRATQANQSRGAQASSAFSGANRLSITFAPYCAFMCSKSISGCLRSNAAVRRTESRE
jgi:hypothetical protein